jgi:hypothetical protein
MNTQARKMSQSEIPEDLQDVSIDGKSWFEVATEDGDSVFLLASDESQAVRYADGHYGEVH